MDRLDVTPSALVHCADALLRAAKDISTDLDELQHAMAALRLDWNGDAQVAFDYAQTAIRGDLDAHRENLNVIAEQVRKLSADYGATDRTAARALGGQ